MSIKKHQENRLWAFEALTLLEEFTNDPEFEGDKSQEINRIRGKRSELKDGKYRVVFLGEFNVGKTTLINAFFGDTYLPMVLEECTAKVTHVMSGDTMQLILRSQSPIPSETIQVLREFFSYTGIEADISPDTSYNFWVITYKTAYPEDIHRTLSAIVTLTADEEFPKLKILREKVDEVIVVIPEKTFEEDIALVDSPGVHSITETHKKITEDIIPNCHLVICLLDSQSAGNEHNRDFISKLVREYQRKVFFVINKSDQLNPDEIDPQGRRGPAKDLLRCIDGIVDNPEIFFVSALYALYASQLRRGTITLNDIDKNEKIHIPYQIRSQLEQTLNPAEEIANYLMTRSSFGTFKERFLDYLYRENREGAILTSVCRFIRDIAHIYAKPFEIKIQLAQQNPRLERIRKERQQLQKQIEENMKFMNDIIQIFDTITAGGTIGENKYEGYEHLISRLFSRQNIENDIFKLIRQWLCTGDNLTKARKNKYLPLQQYLGEILDNFLKSTSTEINRVIDEYECYITRDIIQKGYNFTSLPYSKIELEKGAIVAIDASLAFSYFLFFLGGAVLGGVTGAIIGEGFLSNFQWADWLGMAVPIIPHLSAYILGGIGTVLGALLGLIARSFGGDEIRREKLIEKISEYIEKTLIQGIKESLKKNVETRKSQFISALQSFFDNLNTELNQQILKLAEEENRLEQAQKELILRLQGKIDKLNQIANCAHEIVDSTFKITSGI
ncbi:MAG TPA: dynamin family protein [Candidatus Hydrogenedens sp.]|nr:dynamin family protein [Candidatus Hydrogenedens sp.]